MRREKPKSAIGREPGSATGGTLLAKSTACNLLGQGLPLLVALLCLPVVIGGLGPQRTGLLVLTWSVLGYAGIFDLGLGRAIARFIAAALARGALDEVPRILGTALVTQALIGAAGGFVIAVAAPVLVADVFGLPAGLQMDGRATLQLVALAVPALLVSNSLRGALYAAQRFDLVNAVSAPASSSTYLVSAIGVYAGWGLPTIVALLVAAKAVALVALWRLTRHHCPGLRGRRLGASRPVLGELLRFGSWMTVSSVVFPAVIQAERFLIPALLSVAALTFYTVPYEAISRTAILPVSMALTLFPAFSRFAGRDEAALTDLVVRPMRYLLLVTTPVLAIAALFAHALLAAWMGTAFAAEAAAALQILAIAFHFSAFSHILRAAIQGLGRPDLKAKLDLMTGALFLLLFLVLVPRLGIAGAAIAKAAMTATELAGLLMLASRVAPRALHPYRLSIVLRPAMTAAAAFVIAACLAVMWLPQALLSAAAVAALTVMYVTVFWKRIADATDRRAVAGLQEWIPRRPGSSRLPPQEAGDVLPEQLEIR